MATTTKEPVSTAPPNPLQESFARVMGTSPLSADAGTANLINYEDTGGFRAPQGDVITISGDPGTGATTAETWGHEIQLENLRREQLEFEYQQEQESIANALRQQENERAAQQLLLSQQTGRNQQQEAARAAALAPYQLENAQYSAQAAALDVAAKRRAELDALQVQASMRENAAYQQWGSPAITPSSSAAWAQYRGSPYSQGYRGQSTNAFYGVPAGTNPYTGQYQQNYVAPARGTIIGNPYLANSVRY